MIGTEQNVYRRRYYWFVFGPKIFDEEDTINCGRELLKLTSWMPGIIEFYDNTPRQRFQR